jgi:hypothetical protein
MRALVLVVMALVGTIGASARGSANPPTVTAAEACTAALAAGPWKAIFGTRPDRVAALALLRQAARAGFKNLTMVAATAGQVEIDLFGITTYHTGLDLVREARSASLQVTIQPSRDRYCPDRHGDWEGVFGHPATVPAAISLRSAVLKAGFVSAAIERDGPHDYEVEVAGLRSLSQGREFQKEAKTAGYRVTLERS